jgi:hypothetical protein
MKGRNQSIRTTKEEMGEKLKVRWREWAQQPGYSFLKCKLRVRRTRMSRPTG